MRVVRMLVTCLSAWLLVAAPAAAIDAGVPDLDAHPNVGLLVADLDGPGGMPPTAWCTGMVLSETVFLTAAHCITALPPGTSWGVTLEGGSPADPVATPGYFPQEFPFPVLVPVLTPTDVVVHPDFAAGGVPTNDVAVLLFPEGTFAGVTPVALPAQGSLERPSQRGDLAGAAVTLVGYGTDPQYGDGRVQLFSRGYRQTTTAPLVGVTSTWTRVLGTTPSRDGGGLCVGDSGSPQLLDGVAISLLSRVTPTCRGAAHAQRLDTAPVQAFLAQFVDLG